MIEGTQKTSVLIIASRLKFFVLKFLTHKGTQYGERYILIDDLKAGKVTCI